MDEDFGAGGGKGCLVVVEGAVELGFGREFGVDARRAHEIEGGDGLVKKAAPEMKWEVGISGAEQGNQVIFEGGDCSL